MSQSKPPAGKGAPATAEAPTVTEQPPAPRDAARGVKEEIVYLNLAELHPFKNHPFGVRDDAEMQGLVESVKAAGVNQPALVRPREGGGYEIIAGHRRQRASELAGFVNMPCIVRNMTDDEAILAMTDDNLRHREKIAPTERGAALKQQVEAIKHQGARPGEADKDAGKRSTQIVGDRNGMNYKQVQRYIRLTELVPELRDMVDASKLAFTPAVEISFIRPKYQKYIAVAIEGQASSPSLSQAQKMRELDKEGKLNGDVIDGKLTYIRCGDYDIPNLKLSEQPETSIGKYGRMRKSYLKEHRPILYNQLLMSEELYPHLLEIDRTAQERMDTMLPHMMEAAGVTEELKACDPMRWVGLMNTLTAQIEEILIRELICS